MITLTYGYQKPEAGDIGDVIFDAFENNIDLMNNHNHDGLTGAKISSANLEKLEQSIVSSSWSLQGDGIYRQLVNIVGGRLYEDLIIDFRDTDTGDMVMLEAEQVNPASFYIYTNDATLNITVLYS